MTGIDPPSLSPQSESYAEEVSYPSDVPSSEESSNSSNSVITFYKPPTLLSLLRTAAINLILPFINGVMLGFGEIFAHEVAFRWGWRGAKVYPIFSMNWWWKGIPGSTVGRTWDWSTVWRVECLRKRSTREWDEKTTKRQATIGDVDTIRIKWPRLRHGVMKTCLHNIFGAHCGNQD